jgi:hypothetical protein
MTMLTDYRVTPSTIMAGEVVGEISPIALEEAAQILSESAPPGTVYVVTPPLGEDEAVAEEDAS